MRSEPSRDVTKAWRVERLIALGAARVIATCSDEVFELVRMGLPRHRCAIVPCGVDVNMFAARDPRPPADRLWRLLAIGRMIPRNGFDIPITALAHLPTTELLITGGPAGGEFAHDPEAQRLVATAENSVSEIAFVCSCKFRTARCPH